MKYKIEKIVEYLREISHPESVVGQAVTMLEQLQAENDRLRRERNEAVIDMTALAAGHCCDLCAVEYCIVRGKTEICATFKWRGPKEASHD